MSSNIKSQYYTGSAKISDRLHIHMADNGFYSFINNEVAETLNDIVYADDIPLVNQAISRLDENEESYSVLRVLKEGKDLCLISARFTKDDNEMFGERLINFYLTDIDALLSHTDVIESRVDTLLSYIDLMDTILLAYDIDADDFRIFSSEKLHTFFYTGTLKNFLYVQKDKVKICESHKTIFEELYNDFVNGVEEFKVGIKVKHADSQEDYKWCEVYGKTLNKADGRRIVLAKLDIRNGETFAENISTINNARDFGTGLANKATILSYARALLESRPEHGMAMAIIDLDNFKHINDTYGHKFGDEVLAKTAKIIKEAVGDRGMAGRIGGDEMMIVINDVASDAELRGFLRTIRVNVEWSYKGIKDDLEISCSIGAVRYPLVDEPFESMFEIADKMLYLAKEKGRNRYIIYVPEYHYEYVKGIAPAVVRDIDRVQYNKTGIVYEVIEAISKNVSVEELTNNAIMRFARAFDLDDVSYIRASDCMRVYGFGYGDGIDPDNSYLKEEGYQDLFDDNDVCVFSSITFVDRWSMTAYEYFKSQKLCATIQYRHIENGEIKGYLSFNKSKFSKKWTEMDIAMIAIVSKHLGIYLTNIGGIFD